jgi:hypothetical protein
VIVGAAASAPGSSTAYMSVAVTGGTPVQTVPSSLFAYGVTNNTTIQASATFVLTGLPPAPTALTFTAKYEIFGTGNPGSATFANRSITIVPLPGAVTSVLQGP